jgi:TonB family protein
MSVRRSLVAVFAAAMLLTSSRQADAQASLSSARELYAAAAYDEALTALNSLAARGDAISESATVALYRALCLYALGRNTEGDRAVDLLVAQHPFYRPPMDELSPRLRTTVVEARRRMLPGLLQQKYAEAKSAYEQKDYATAIAGFTQVIDGLADPDIATAARLSPLADLGTLAGGFRDLANKATAPLAVSRAAVVLPPPVAAESALRTYSSDDIDVKPPVPIRQNIPPYTRPVTQRKTAVVELLVDESGEVESAVMLSPLDPAYDRAVTSAAKGWTYEPAKADGKAVRYQKRVQITLVPDAERSRREE